MKPNRASTSLKCSLAVAAALAAVGGPADVRAQVPADGTWNSDSDGNWDDATKWLNGVVADGVDRTARFEVDLTATRTVTVTPSPGTPGTRTIGNLFARDVNNTTAFDWVLGPDGAGTTLTLDVTAGLAQANIPNRVTTINAVLAGTDGLRKIGAGNLAIGGTSTLTGPVHVLEGELRLVGASGSLLGPTSFIVDRGALELNNNTPVSTINGNRVSDAATIRLSTGALQIVGPDAGVVDETVGAVTARGGAAIRNQPNAGTAATFLRLTSLTRETATDQVRFTKANAGAFGAGSRIIIGGQGDTPFLGGWATAVNDSNNATNGNYSSDFVRYDNADATTGGLTGPTGVRPLDRAGRPAVLTDATLTDVSDVRVTDAAPPAMDAPRTVRSVVFASPSAGGPGTTTTLTQDLGGHTLNIASGGLLRASRGLTAANAATDFFVVNNGNVTAGGSGAGGTLFVTVQESGNTTNQLHVNAAVTNSPGGAVGLAKNGAGLLILRGNNTYTGGTVVNEGQIQPEYAPGINPLGTGPITMVAGTLQMRSDQPVTNAGNNMITDGANPRLFGGRVPATPATAGPVAFNFGTLTVNNTSGLPTVQFDFETNPGSFAAASPTDAATFNFGQATINADTIFNVTREGAAPDFRNTLVRVAGVTDGAGSFSLIKSSNGFLEITAPSTYDDGTSVNLGRLTVSGTGTLGTGPTTVNGGSLLANSASTGPGAVTVNNTGLLGGTGGVGGPVTVNPGGTLAPGAAGGGIGTLTAAGPVTFGPGTGTPPVFLVELVPVGSSDVLALSGAGAAGLLTLTNPDTLHLVTNDTGTYTIATFASRAGEFDSVLMNGIAATFGAPGSGRDVEIAYNPNNIQVTVNRVVPEPATAGVLGIAAVGLLARRRRRVLCR